MQGSGEKAFPTEAARAPVSVKQEEVWSLGRRAESIMPGPPGSDGLLMCGALTLQTHLIHRLCLDRLTQAPLTYWPTNPYTGYPAQVRHAKSKPPQPCHLQRATHFPISGLQAPRARCAQRELFFAPPLPRAGESLCLSARHCSHQGGCSVLKPFRAALGNL